MNKSLVKPNQKNGLPISFLWGMAGALAIFLPFLLVDKGFYLYCGDYNEQQIPFYLYANHFIKQWGGTWSWATDMGTSFVNSYSFYNLGSPFLWLTLWLPSRLMPFAMVPIFALKFGCISAASYLYLSRYSKNRNFAIVCSLAYTFCGFNVYNIFFNHMLEPVLLFPLMLWAMDAFIYEDVRGAFAFSVGLALLDNYFFFAGNVVFLLIYFIVKLLCKEYTLSLKKFGLLAFEAVLGVGIGMALALPSFLSLLGNPRTENFANGMGLVMYGNVQQYFAILTSLFLPPDPPYLPNLFPDAAIKWTSMSLFLPIVGMGGVLAYANARKNKGTSTRILLFTCLIMALVPILNSSFYAFNASYYARWYYMPLLIAALATLRSLDDEDIDLAAGAKLSAIFTFILIIFGLLPTKKDDVWHLGVQEDTRKFWLTFLTAMLAAMIFWVLARFYRKHVRFAPFLLAAVMGFSVFYSVIHMSLAKFPWYERDGNYRQMQWQGSADVHLPEGQFYRIDTYEAHDNLGLWLDKSCIRTFNSVITPSIMEFYPYVGVKRDVSSKPETDYYALRGLLGVQYTLVPTDKSDDFLTQPGVEGWKLWATQGPYDIYENQNFVPMGFTYDQFVSMDFLDVVATEDRSPILMRAIGLDASQVGQYRHLFDSEAIWWETTQDPGVTTVQSETGWYQYDPVTFSRYVEDCDARRAQSAHNFTADNSGFVCDINLDKENLVFFGVPWDPGFSAQVNGQPANVLKVSKGMMAVYAPAGENHIVFTYRTPGFMAGCLISLSCLVLLAFYIYWCRKSALKKAALPQADAFSAADATLNSPQNHPDEPLHLSNTPQPQEAPAAAPLGENQSSEE